MVNIFSWDENDCWSCTSKRIRFARFFDGTVHVYISIYIYIWQKRNPWLIGGCCWWFTSLQAQRPSNHPFHKGFLSGKPPENDQPLTELGDNMKIYKKICIYIYTYAQKRTYSTWTKNPLSVHLLHFESYRDPESSSVRLVGWRVINPARPRLGLKCGSVPPGEWSFVRKWTGWKKMKCNRCASLFPGKK